jgi:hypothetical protein
MKFNLEGLQQFDVLVRLTSCTSTISIKFASKSLALKYMDSFDDFQEIGLEVWKSMSDYSDVQIGNFSDGILIAERIALAFESEGLSVERRAWDGRSTDKSARFLVQSFILA